MKCGITDFLLKPVRDEELLERVKDAIGQSRHAAARHARERAIRRRFERLTPRERQVMEMVVAGRPNKKVAADLGVSIKTVEVHRSRVMRKMEAPSLANLVEQSMVAGVARRQAAEAG
jgi:RNA polymerase sigma factor (sigma-70 family)